MTGRPASGPPYDPARYWSDLHQRSDLSAVGQSALPAAMNAWLYQILEGNLRRFLGRHGLLRPAPAAAFDVGMGTGYWVRMWRALGVPVVDGCDLVPAAVERIGRETAEAGAAGRFVVADIGLPGSLPAAEYPLVSCLNVLLHVTDDAAFERALHNVAALVAPGGVLLLAEPILRNAAWERPHDPASHSRARAIERYRVPLEAAGLRLVDLRPATVLANNPIEAVSAGAFARYGRWWRFVARWSKRGAGHARWLGPLLFVLDRLAMATGAAPTTKFALFRRPTPEPS